MPVPLPPPPASTPPITPPPASVLEDNLLILVILTTIGTVLVCSCVGLLWLRSRLPWLSQQPKVLTRAHERSPFKPEAPSTREASSFSAIVPGASGTACTEGHHTRVELFTNEDDDDLEVTPFDGETTRISDSWSRSRMAPPGHARHDEDDIEESIKESVHEQLHHSRVPHPTSSADPSSISHWERREAGRTSFAMAAAQVLMCWLPCLSAPAPILPRTGQREGADHLALSLQRHTRGRSTRRWLEKDRAARRLQGWWRRLYLSRVALEMMARIVAVRRLQRWWRRRMRLYYHRRWLLNIERSVGPAQTQPVASTVSGGCCSRIDVYTSSEAAECERQVTSTTSLLPAADGAQAAAAVTEAGLSPVLAMRSVLELQRLVRGRVARRMVAEVRRLQVQDLAVRRLQARFCSLLLRRAAAEACAHILAALRLQRWWWRRMCGG